MKTASNPSLLPLPLEVVEGQSTKALLCAPAAAAVTDKQMAVLNSDLLTNAIGTSNFLQRSLPIFVIYSKTRA